MTESEIKALDEGCKNTQCLRLIMDDLGLHRLNVMPLYSDNSNKEDTDIIIHKFNPNDIEKYMNEYDN